MTTTRRTVLQGLAAATALAATPRFVQAQTSEPIRLGFQLHRTGIGAAYGRWYERTAHGRAQGAERRRRHQRPPGRDRLRGRRHRPQARRRGGREVRRPEHGPRLRHPLLPRRHGLRPPRRRAADPLPRLLRGPPRRLRRAQPLDAAARHHRREEPGPRHGPVGGVEPRQEGHDDLPRLRLRLRPPRLLHRRDAGAGRRGHRAPRHPADRDLLHPLPAAHPQGDRGHLPRHGRPRRPHLRQGARRVLRLRPATRRSSASSTSLEAVDITTPGLEFLDGSHFWEGHPRYKQPDASRATRPSTAPPSASTTTAPRSPTPRRSPPTPTCSPPGRRSSSSRRRWRPPATRAPPTARRSSRRSRR